MPALLKACPKRQKRVILQSIYLFLKNTGLNPHPYTGSASHCADLLQRRNVCLKECQIVVGFLCSEIDSLALPHEVSRTQNYALWQKGKDACLCQHLPPPSDISGADIIYMAIYCGCPQLRPRIPATETHL